MRRHDSSRPYAPTNTERADRRLRRWKSQPPFDSGDFFARRLALEGMEEAELHRLLGEPAEALRDRQAAAPGWLETLREAFRADGPVSDVPPGKAEADPGIGGFLSALAPIIRMGQSRVSEGLRSLVPRTPRLPFDPASVEGLFLDALARRLLKISIPTLVLELNVARVQGLLEGETAEERFRSFLVALRERHLIVSVLNEYPVLGRLLTEAVGQWADFCLEFLRRLTADWEDLRDTFLAGSDPGLLVRVEMGAGDSHREGRSVVVAEFSSGFRVVYKPRSLAVDLHFQELLAWMNERGDHPPFSILRIINRSTHGWTEFVEAAGCAETEELRRFYRRQGGYLAVLYAVDAVDFHAENLVASGEYPVLIDLEALFHPRVAGSAGAGSTPDADRTHEWTVLRVGLLPFFVGGDETTQGVDMSGLGRPPGQISPFGLPHWEDPGTDTMHLAARRVALPVAKNRPSFRGADVDPAAYAGDVAVGFAQVYELLLEHKHRLLSTDGPLSRFAADEVRFIARDTQSYAAVLQASYHPDALRDALDRDRVLDLLWVQAAGQPALVRLIGAERRDLSKGDIPLFTARPGSRDLWINPGEHMVDFFDHAGINEARRRIETLSREDLALQVRTIRESLPVGPEAGTDAQNPGRIGE